MGRNKPRLLVTAAALGGLGALVSSPAWAYVGPGAGLTALGSVFALFAAIGLAIVGFIWYPFKRLYRKLKGTAKASPGEPAA